MAKVCSADRCYNCGAGPLDHPNTGFIPSLDGSLMCQVFMSAPIPRTDVQVWDWVRYTVRGDDNYVGIVLNVDKESVFLADGATVPNAGIREVRRG